MKRDNIPESTPEIPLFLGFYLEAAGSISKRPFAVVFGLLAVFFGTDALSLFDAGMPFETFLEPLERMLREYPMTFLLVIPALVISVFLRTALLLCVSDRKCDACAASKRSVSMLPRLFGLEAGTATFIVIVASLLLLPSVLASDVGLSSVLETAGVILIVFISILLLFTRIFAVFHIVLSGLTLSSAIEAGYSLFRSRMTSSTLFGTLSLCVGFLISLFLAVIFPLFERLFSGCFLRSAIGIILIWSILALHAVIQKRAWFSFFRFIASPKEPEESMETSQDSEKVIQKKVPETGQA